MRELILTMVFTTQTGIKVSFSVNNVKEDISDAQVKTLMDVLITKNVFITKGGDLMFKTDAYMTEKVKSNFNLA